MTLLRYPNNLTSFKSIKTSQSTAYQSRYCLNQSLLWRTYFNLWKVITNSSTSQHNKATPLIVIAISFLHLSLSPSHHRIVGNIFTRNDWIGLNWVGSIVYILSCGICPSICRMFLGFGILTLVIPLDLFCNACRDMNVLLEANRPPHYDE